MINLRGNLIYTGNGVVENGVVSIDGSTIAGMVPQPTARWRVHTPSSPQPSMTHTAISA